MALTYYLEIWLFEVFLRILITTKSNSGKRHRHKLRNVQMRSVKKNQNILADSCSPDSSSPEAGSVPDKPSPETGSIADKSSPEADSIEHNINNYSSSPVIKVTIKKTA